MNQALIVVLIFIFLFIAALAYYTKATGGLFLARMPWKASDYEPTEENKTERQVGLAFSAFAFKLCAVALPLLLVFYDSMVTKIIGGLLVIGIVIYRFQTKAS